MKLPNLQFLALLFIIISLPNMSLAENSMKVGVMLPMSGDTAYIGEACKNGMEMALDEVGKKQKDSIELHFEDHKFDSKTSVSTFRRLVQQEKVDAVVNFSSNTGKATGPLADASKIPMIALASDPEVVKGRSHVVNFWVTPEDQVKLLLKELKRRGIKKIARISAIHNATASWNKAMDASMDDVPQIGLDSEFPLDVRDFKPFLVKLQQRQDEFDAIFVNLFFGQVGVFAKQARELGIKLPLFNIETFEDTNEVQTSAGALVGQWYIQSDDGTDSFVERYQKRFPEKSIYGAANCYDIVQLLSEAVEAKMDSKALTEFLHTLKDFKGVTGTFSASGDNRFTLPATVKVVTETGFQKAALGRG